MALAVGDVTGITGGPLHIPLWLAKCQSLIMKFGKGDSVWSYLSVKLEGRHLGNTDSRRMGSAFKVRS